VGEKTSVDPVNPLTMTPSAAVISKFENTVMVYGVVDA
jgi:hypothetical protein